MVIVETMDSVRICGVWEFISVRLSDWWLCQNGMILKRGRKFKKSTETQTWQRNNNADSYKKPVQSMTLVDELSRKRASLHLANDEDTNLRVPDIG